MAWAGRQWPVVPVGEGRDVAWCPTQVLPEPREPLLREVRRVPSPALAVRPCYQFTRPLIGSLPHPPPFALHQLLNYIWCWLSHFTPAGSPS